MLNEIISKWTLHYKNWHLAITEDKQVYDIKTTTKLIKYWNNGTISYRLPKTTNRIGIKTINKNCKLNKIIIQEYIPF